MMEIRSSGRSHGNQIFRKSSWKSALPDTSTSGIRSSGRAHGNQVFRKSGLPEIRSSRNQVFRKSGLSEIRSSRRAHGNQHVQKPALPESGLPEEVTEIRSSGRDNGIQFFWKT